MIAEIESILVADDAARQEVASAEAKAEWIKALAQSRAESAVLEKKRELAASIGKEEEQILEEARFRTGKILEETSHYIEGLQDRKDAVLNDLVDSLLRKVTGT